MYVWNRCNPLNVVVTVVGGGGGVLVAVMVNTRIRIVSVSHCTVQIIPTFDLQTKTNNYPITVQIWSRVTRDLFSRNFMLVRLRPTNRYAML